MMVWDVIFITALQPYLSPPPHCRTILHAALYSTRTAALMLPYMGTSFCLRTDKQTNRQTNKHTSVTFGGRRSTPSGIDNKIGKRAPDSVVNAPRPPRLQRRAQPAQWLHASGGLTSPPDMQLARAASNQPLRKISHSAGHLIRARRLLTRPLPCAKDKIFCGPREALHEPHEIKLLARHIATR